jgi:hypothetical protein
MSGKMDMPVEFFGQSDMHPIIYMLCKGDPNNYRIWKYGEKQNINKIICLSKKYTSFGDEHATRFRPSFIYNRYNEKIKNIRRNCGITAEEAIEFWNENPSYSYTKPTDPEDLETWLKSKYFVNSFIKAYNRDTRSIRTLRLSMFSSGKCMSSMTNDQLVNFYNNILPTSHSMQTNEWHENTMTIKEYFNWCFKTSPEHYSEQECLLYVFNGDATVKTIYSFFSDVIVTKIDKEYLGNTISCFVPPRPKWIPISSPTSILIQFFDSESLAIKNNPYFKRWSAVTADRDKLIKEYDFLTDNNVDKRLIISRLAMMLENNEIRKTVCMSINKDKSDILSFLRTHLSVLNSSLSRLVITGKHNLKIYDPFKGTESILLGWNAVNETNRLITMDICSTIALCETRTTMTKKNITEMLESSTVTIDDRVENVIEYISSISVEEFKQLPLSRTDKQNISFLKMYLLNDPTFVSILLENDMFCSYGWNSSNERISNNVKTGFVDLFIKFQNSTSVFRKNWDTGSNRLITDTFSPSKAMCIFRICLSLIGDITISNLEQNFYQKLDQKYLVDFQTNKYTVRRNYQIVKGFEGICFPIILGENVRWGGNYNHYNYMLRNNISVKDLSVYNGKYKIYTLDINNLYDSGTVEYGKCIYKGLRLSSILNDNHKRNLLRLNSNINISEYLENKDFKVERSKHGISFIKEDTIFEEKKEVKFDYLDELLENDIGLMDIDINFMPEELELIDYEDDSLLIEAGPKISASISDFQIYKKSYEGPRSVSSRKSLPDLYLNSVMDELKIEKTMTPSRALGWAVCISRLREANETVKAEAVIEALKTCRMKKCREFVNGHSIEFDGMDLCLYKVLNLSSKGNEHKIMKAMEKGAKVYLNNIRIFELANDREFYSCDVPVNNVDENLFSCILKSDFFPEKMKYLFKAQMDDDFSNLEDFLLGR